MKKGEKLQDFHHVRHEAQRQKMIEAAQLKICPFCPRYLKKYHDHPLERTGEHWILTKNDYPYEGTARHYLLVHRRHVSHLSEISASAWSELTSHFKWLEQKHHLPGGAFFLRFGDSIYTGATITHLHAHLIVGGKRQKNNSSEILNVALGYQNKKVATEGRHHKTKH